MGSSWCSVVDCAESAGLAAGGGRRPAETIAREGTGRTYPVADGRELALSLGSRLRALAAGTIIGQPMRGYDLGSFLLVFGLVAGVIALPASAHAQGTASANGPGVAPELTHHQLSAFASLVGDPVPVVALRLRSDEGLRSLAGEAADARIHRLGKGKIMTTIGVLGVVAGVAMVVGGEVGWSRVDHAYTSAETDRVDGVGSLLLIATGGVLAGGGLVVGLIGLHALEVPSDAEYRARDRYGMTAPSSEAHARLRGTSTRAFGFPLLAFRF
jgi:hypothetical protein